MKTYLFRRGDGNEGNFPRFLVTLTDSDCPYAAVRALLANEFIVRSASRQYVLKNVEIDGEEEFGIHATVSEGRKGETAFGAAWMTAELQPISEEDAAYERDQWARSQYALRDVLDRAALRQYRRELKQSRVNRYGLFET